MTTSFLISHRRPIIHALFTGDTELLGDLNNSSLRGRELLADEEFFQLMTRHGLLRDTPDLAYALKATATGFYLLDSVNPEAAERDPETKADALATTIQRAFEPAADPAPEALNTVASELIALFEDVIGTYRKHVYTHDQPG